MRSASGVREHVFIAASAFVLGATSGCAPGSSAQMGRHDRSVVAAADAILAMAPNQNWTTHYNRLAESPRAALEYLLSRPAITQHGPRDSLDTLLCTSLAALLVQSADLPKLTLYAFETSSDVLHLSPKAGGREVGEIFLDPDHPPIHWQDLYPAEFDHAAAAAVDIEADRQAMLSWWRLRRESPSQAWITRPLQPKPERLFRLLSRRYADRWVYMPSSTAGLRVADPPEFGLFSLPTEDYNLVRAACIQLGSSADLDVTERLVELIGDGSTMVAHNAQFALGFHPNARIRAAVQRARQRTKDTGEQRWSL